MAASAPSRSIPPGDHSTALGANPAVTKPPDQPRAETGSERAATRRSRTRCRGRGTLEDRRSSRRGPAIAPCFHSPPWVRVVAAAISLPIPFRCGSPPSPSRACWARGSRGMASPSTPASTGARTTSPIQPPSPAAGRSATATLPARAARPPFSEGRYDRFTPDTPSTNRPYGRPLGEEVGSGGDRLGQFYAGCDVILQF